jgi:hypothetical protein
VDHLALPLDAAAHGDHAGAHHDAAKRLKHLRPNHQVGNPGLVLQSDEHHAFGAAGPLPNKHETRRLKPTLVARVHGLSAGDNAARGKIVTQEGNRVLAERQTHMAVILHHFTACGHRAECDYGFFNLGRGLVLASCGRCEEREGFVAKRLDCPKGFAPDKTQCGPESIGLGELDKGRRRDAGAPPEIIDGQERPLGLAATMVAAWALASPFTMRTPSLTAKRPLITGRL